MNPESKAENHVRNMKKNKINLAKFRINVIFVCLFFVFILVMGILFFFPKSEKSELKKIENNNSVPAPKISVNSLMDGSFTHNLSLYYTDNFSFRDELIFFMNDVKDLKGIKHEGITIIGSESNITEAETETVFEINEMLSTSFILKDIRLDGSISQIDINNPHIVIKALSENDTENKNVAESKSENENIEGEKTGPLFIIGDTALEIFSGSEEKSLEYANVINEYSELFPSEVTVFNLIVPNHFEYGLPEKYKGTVGKPQRKYIDIVKDNLSEEIIFVDIYDTMKEHYDEGEYLYFRTDHHWTGLGAFRAYEKFCEYANMTPISLDCYEKRTTTGFLGTLYASSLKKELKDNPDYVEYYVTDLPHTQINTNKDGSSYRGHLISEYSDGRTNGYLTFMGGDIPLATISTLNDNGKSIIVFKESYGNAFIPFLVPHYEKIYVADIRSFPYDAISFIDNNNIDHVLFLNNIMASNTGARIENIKNLKA